MNQFFTHNSPPSKRVKMIMSYALATCQNTFCFKQASNTESRKQKTKLRRQKNLTSEFSGLIYAWHNKSSSIGRLQELRLQDNQNSQMPDFAGTNFTNVIYTK